MKIFQRDTNSFSSPILSGKNQLHKKYSLTYTVLTIAILGVLSGCGGGGGGGEDTSALPSAPEATTPTPAPNPTPSTSTPAPSTSTPSTPTPSPAPTPSPSGDGGNTTAPVVQVLSSRAEYVSGGSALIEISLPAISSGTAPPLVATIDGTDVSSNFQPEAGKPTQMLGLIKNMSVGSHTLTTTYGAAMASINLTNYPLTGPIFSGPHLTPFVCQTQDFMLPDGTHLGAATDADCSVPTKVMYLYRSSTDGTLKTMTSTSQLPLDVAMTTTSEGKNVPFVIRVETGTVDRGIYQSMVLYDPTHESAPSPLTPPANWNKRLIALQGSGCTGGWYIQGNSMGVDPLAGDNLAHLGQGFAIFINTLTSPSNNCNATAAAESTMMSKEHFIKTYGAPLYTVGIGSSGGAYSSLQIADAYPGVLDGILIQRSFPDALSITNSALDSHLLTHYYLSNNSAGFSETQMVAVAGNKNARAWYDLALQAGRADPVPGRSDPIPASPSLGTYQSAVWDGAVPIASRYDPVSRPQGARPTVFDIARNIYGVDASGYALRPFDNVGVQYGLQALNAGTITTTQFLDLNEKIGGYDRDSNFITPRSSADLGAIKRAYQSGMQLGGGGGLASIPVFDVSGTYDEDEAYHYQWFRFAVRERIAQANGNSANHVMWRGTPGATAGAQSISDNAWNIFTQWMDAYKADASSSSQRAKVIADKPATAVDGCYTDASTPQFIAETQTFSRQPDSQCNQRWPSYSYPRNMAGEDVSASKLKCQLKPVVAADYQVTFSTSEMTRLKAIFPTGVCDWSKAGVNQVPVVTDSSFGPSTVNLIAGG